MPAKSKSQQRLFGMAIAYKKGKMKGASKKIKDIAKDMPEKEIEKFAKTKRSKLKENLVVPFEQFVNEAHVNPKGELEDFNVYDDPDVHKSEVEDFISNMTEFFKDNDATEVKVDVRGPLVKMRFKFYDEIYGFIGNLDDGYGELAKLDINKRDAKILGQFSDMSVFFDMIKEQGLYFLRNIE